MSDESESEIEIFRCLNFLRDNAGTMAQAKADRVQVEEFRKSKKALLMQKAEDAGHKSAAIQEREAYAHPEYIEFLNALAAAVEKEEKMRWLMRAAEARIECWRSLESTRRIEGKNI
jgi:hypothetical protein